MSKSQNLRDPSQAPRSFEDLVERLASQLQSKQDPFQSHETLTTSSRSFDWLKCKPTRYYHLSSWVQSLDDTPEQFQEIKTPFAPQRRGVTKYLTGKIDSDSLELTYTKETVKHDITPEDLEYLSAYDFNLNDDFTITPNSIVLEDSRLPGALVTHHFRLLKSLNDSVSCPS